VLRALRACSKQYLAFAKTLEDLEVLVEIGCQAVLEAKLQGIFRF
jgi:hypothetical protein